MMTRLISSVLAAFSALMISTACAVAQVSDPTAPDAVVEYGGPEPVVIDTANGPVTLTVELAETPEARQRGLMHRESMGADEGMLFDFQEERVVSIWMENTLIGLDIAYIRSDGTIAKIITGAQPMSRRQLYSDVPVLSVLEINSGRAAELGIAPGDVVRHRWFGTAEDTPAAPAETQTDEGGSEPDERDAEGEPSEG
ncbi:MAG: DUF192 domain-containing protein [Alphaproteobacteria bacterium]|nr:DUF192 domain-containing protein [Alphaproteobacteria bacterium]